MEFPVVEVLNDNGKPLVGSEARVDPSVMQFIMAAVSAAKMSRLVEIQEGQVSKGVTRNYGPKLIRGAATEALNFSAKFPMDEPMQSVSITNDGPGNCYVKVNRNSTEFLAYPREVVNISFTNHVIYSISLRVDAGATATVRGIAKG